MASMDELKKAAGVRAADMIKDGMIVGLGTGDGRFDQLEHHTPMP